MTDAVAIYYTYAHIRNDTNTVFYIGMGKFNRAWSQKSRSRHWFNIVKKVGYKIQILSTGLSQNEAFEKEKELIKFYGRNDNKTGILVNHTDGGEGVLGVSTEIRKAQSERMKKNHKNPDFAKRRDEIINQVNSDELCRKKSIESRKILEKNREFVKERNKRSSNTMNTLWLDKSFSEKILKILNECRNDPAIHLKQKKTMIARHGKKVICEDTGIIFDSISSAVEWLRQNGKPKARDSSICMACKGQLKTAYGYFWKYYG